MDLLKKIIGYTLKIAFSVAIIWYLLHKSGASFRDFSGLSPLWVLFGMLALLVQNMMTGVRWFSLLRAIGIRISLPEAVSLTMQGVFFTLFIPAGAVSGDLVKATLLGARTSGDERFNGIASILIDRICGFAGLLMAIVITVPAFSPVIRTFPESLQTTVWIVFLFCIAGLCCITALFLYTAFLKIKFIKIIWDWCDRITKGFFNRTANVIELYKKRWKNVIFWSIISGAVLFPLYPISFFCIAKTAVPSSGGHLAPSFLGGMLGEVISIIPLTPGGIGTRDIIVSEIYKGFGFPADTATVITTIFTVVLIIVSSVGALFLIADSVKRKKSPDLQEK